MDSKFYRCEKIIDTHCKSVVSHWIQYRMWAVDKVSGNEEPYLLDFMKWGRLWITDIYPERWANEELRCKRFMSHEGMVIDFRKISNTSVYVFLRDFIDKDEAMVISGSFQDNEIGNVESRKLRMYRYFFNRLRDSLNFKMVESPGMNAFFILKPDCETDVTTYQEEYCRFKGHE